MVGKIVESPGIDIDCRRDPHAIRHSNMRYGLSAGVLPAGAVSDVKTTYV